MSVAVAMVEPQYEINVGYVARIMKNFGCNDLYFVSPRFSNIGDALRYSTHGKNILESAREISLGQLREKFDVLVATTALSGTSRLNVNREAIDPARLAKVISITRDKKNFCIILGRESSGLNNDELAICDLVINIDTKTRYKTMNI
jgi:TrmH family RNA methyltransferase